MATNTGADAGMPKSGKNTNITTTTNYI
jgi:hypothetical protein